MPVKMGNLELIGIWPNVAGYFTRISQRCVPGLRADSAFFQEFGNISRQKRIREVEASATASGLAAETFFVPWKDFLGVLL